MNQLAILLAVALSATTAFAEKACTGNAAVSIDATYTWTAANETTAAAYPSSAHFSGAVCAVSSAPAVFVRGATASPGFINIAETGSRALLVQELKANSAVGAVVETNPTPIGTANGVGYSVKLTATPNASYVSCVSMIAPSPDWIVGLTSFNLCNKETGMYFSETQRLLAPYDAGSDSGKTYTAADSKTEPQGTIARTTEGVIGNYGFIRVTTNGTGGAATTTAGATDASPSPSGEKEKDEDNACFPATATVELEDGSVVPMSHLSVGDSVKVAANEFSKVFMFTHKTSDVRQRFVTLKTAHGASLALTKGHYIYADGALVAAGQVQVGSVITRGDGSVDTVISVGSTVGDGLYNPQTVSGNIVVDGVLASTYTTSVEPTFAHALLSPLRYVFQTFGVSTAVLESGASSLAAPFGVDRSVEF